MKTLLKAIHNNSTSSIASLLEDKKLPKFKNLDIEAAVNVEIQVPNGYRVQHEIHLRAINENCAWKISCFNLSTGLKKDGVISVLPKVKIRFDHDIKDEYPKLFNIFRSEEISGPLYIEYSKDRVSIRESSPMIQNYEAVLPPSAMGIKSILRVYPSPENDCQASYSYPNNQIAKLIYPKDLIFSNQKIIIDDSLPMSSITLGQLSVTPKGGEIYIKSGSCIQFFNINQSPYKYLSSTFGEDNSINGPLHIQYDDQYYGECERWDDGMDLLGDTI